MRSSDSIKKEIAKKYDKDPTGWSVNVGRDRRGFYDLVIIHDSIAWIIKEEQINPYNFVGLGTRTKSRNINPLIDSNQSNFGIRSVSKKQMSQLADAFDKKESVKDMLSKIMTSRPIRTTEVNGPMVLQGPVFHSRKPIEYISENQKKLDLKLKMELENLLNRKYPQVLRPYI